MNDREPPPDLSAASDQEVVAWARQGREEAYRERLRRYQPSVFALIYRIVRHRERAKDLTQETFVKALNALDSYRPEFRFAPWILRIANNRAVDYLRRNRLDSPDPDCPPDSITPGQIDARAIQVANRSPSPTPNSDERKVAAAMEPAIRRLRGPYRRCIIPALCRGPIVRRNRRNPGICPWERWAPTCTAPAPS
ncbi:MAG: sigma-70 family RNA polymerase sigma factor [Gemmatimonadetes bacterium]|nr:sigma-70 family RNA polymerase sigma factor [Gemmatimonadota bacterium]